MTGKIAFMIATRFQSRAAIRPPRSDTGENGRSYKEKKCKWCAWRVLISRSEMSTIHSRQPKYGDLGPHVEADAVVVSDGAIDVHETLVSQIESSRSVSLIHDRQSRRVEKRRLALSAVRMSRENP